MTRAKRAKFRSPCPWCDDEIRTMPEQLAADGTMWVHASHHEIPLW